MIDTVISGTPARELAARVDRLHDILRECGSVCIGYSGGVDSVYLAVAALEVLGRERLLAVTGLSPAYPAVQRRVAAECAATFGIPWLEVATEELADERYAANPSNRCYYCKSELWPKLAAVAREHGLAAVLDGSNADDAGDYRPGFAAARENGVRSPLLEAGLTKSDVRELSRRRGLPTWDQPAAPCLASRLPYGVAVTPERLMEVERAEEVLRELGFREMRVRHHDDCLRIELSPADLDAAFDEGAVIARRIAPSGTPRVLIDAEGYRRGALNEALVQIGRPSAPEAPTAVPPHDRAGFHGDVAVVHAARPAEARAAADVLRAIGFRYVAIDAAANGGDGVR